MRSIKILNQQIVDSNSRMTDESSDMPTVALTIMDLNKEALQQCFDNAVVMGNSLGLIETTHDAKVEDGMVLMSRFNRYFS